MKRYILILTVSFAVFISCRHEQAKDVYFNGEIIIVDCNVAPDTLYGEKVYIDGLYAGKIWTYDTLIGFMYPRFPDYFINVFNVNTGEFLYSLGKKGMKADNFNSIAWREQFVYEDFQQHVWIRKDGVEECVLLNLAKPGDAVKRKMDINVDIEFEAGFIFIFILNNSLFLGSNQGEKIFGGTGSFLPPAYHLYNARTKEFIKSYKPYNAFVPVSDEFYNKGLHLLGFGSMDRIKPDDNSKLAMAMHSMDQLNIMDIATGKIKGYRNKNSPDFNYLKYDIDNVKRYYEDLCVDDTYIYAMYSTGNILESNTLNVFDWDGNFIRKIVLDKTSINLSMGFDPVNKYLYIDALSEDDEEVYRYDVSYLYR
jgi:hypothetical protein